LATDFDATIVPGGGVRENYQLTPWAEARFDLALELDRGAPFVCLSQATTHRPPPLDSRGFPISEAGAGARYLAARGVAPDRILLETLSLDTVGNAYFTKLLHVDPSGWRRLLIITSEFHMARTRALFDWIYGFEAGRYELHYAAAENRGITPEGVAARKAWEQRGIDRLDRTKLEVRSLAEFQRWIFTRHDSYSAEGQLLDRPPIDPAALESY
jgi:hypothetical protein